MKCVDEHDLHANRLGRGQGREDGIADEEGPSPAPWATVATASRPNGTAGTGSGAFRRTRPGSPGRSMAMAERV